jgi:nucleoside 2-deoxyribosyltransferase
VIYLASPYTDPDPAVRTQRFNATCAVAALLMRDGHMVFSPVVHGHPLTRHGLPGDWSYWKPHARWHLARCDEIVVLMLEGWEESVGLCAEVEMATALGKPVWYRVPAT